MSGEKLLCDGVRRQSQVLDRPISRPHRHRCSTPRGQSAVVDKGRSDRSQVQDGIVADVSGAGFHLGRSRKPLETSRALRTASRCLASLDT